MSNKEPEREYKNCIFCGSPVVAPDLEYHVSCAGMKVVAEWWLAKLSNQDKPERGCTCPPPKPYDWKHLEGCPRYTPPQEKVEEDWEEEFERLDNNEEFNEFCREWLPTGMGNVHDDIVQTMVARIVASTKRETLEEVKKIMEENKRKYTSLQGTFVERDNYFYNLALSDLCNRLGI